MVPTSGSPPLPTRQPCRPVMSREKNPKRNEQDNWEYIFVLPNSVYCEHSLDCTASQKLSPFRLNQLQLKQSLGFLIEDETSWFSFFLMNIILWTFQNFIDKLVRVRLKWTKATFSSFTKNFDFIKKEFKLLPNPHIWFVRQLQTYLLHKLACVNKSIERAILDQHGP